MLKRLPRILVALALAISIGLHWPVLQIVAWTGMVISYSHESPITEAVVKTFDGQHPCKLCKQIAKEKHSEKKSESKLELSKLEFRYAPATFIFRGPSSYWMVKSSDDAAKLLTQTPPVPPPRGLPG